ncbi:MAG: acyl-CoA thioesterase [Campylobacterales bacterium]|nr:acyl-CoA thioesterase [Campylobacterales bacterium]
MYGMGEPRIKIVAMPKDTNPSGNIFGGWIMSQIDIAGSLATRELGAKQVVTVAVNSMTFKEPVHVGDVLCCYAKVTKAGTTSIQTQVEVVAERANETGQTCVHVTSAVITYVNVDKEGGKKPLHVSQKQREALDLDHPLDASVFNKGYGI